MTAEPAGRVITAALVVVPGPGDTVTSDRHADPQRRRGHRLPRELIAGRLARERIAMTNLLTGETFGRQTVPRPVTEAVTTGRSE